MDDERTEETPMPEAPKGASFSLDENKVDTSSQANGDSERYLAEKSEIMTPEGMINAFRELRETDDPINAILITEFQEMKALVQRVNVTLAILLPVGIVTAGCLALIMLDINKAVKS